MRKLELKALAAALVGVFVVSVTSVFGAGSSVVLADERTIRPGTILYPGDTFTLADDTYISINDSPHYEELCWAQGRFSFADSFEWGYSDQWILVARDLDEPAISLRFSKGYGWAVGTENPIGIICTGGDGLTEETAFTFELLLEPVRPMYRLYNPDPNSGEHFYTADIGERDYLISLGWNDEGIGWYAPVESSTPVYRLYNANAGEHHYTKDAGERDYLLSLGWNDEGIGWYSDDSMRVPLYRQYNPNAFANNHNYTTSQEENDWLVSLGWQAEGIGWYGVEITHKVLFDILVPI